MIRIILLLAFIPLATAVLIPPGHTEKIGPIYKDGVTLWDSKFNGRGDKFDLHYIKANGRDSDWITEGSYILNAVIRASNNDHMFIGIHNPDLNKTIDVTYNLNDISPGPDIFMIMFFIITPVILLVGGVTSFCCLGAGLLMARCMTGDTYLNGPMDEDFKEKMLANSAPIIL